MTPQPTTSSASLTTLGRGVEDAKLQKREPPPREGPPRPEFADYSAAASRRVVLGDTYGTMWCVDEGLAEGEQVVTAGQQKLRNGMKVIPVIR